MGSERRELPPLRFGPRPGNRPEPRPELLTDSQVAVLKLSFALGQIKQIRELGSTSPVLDAALKKYTVEAAQLRYSLGLNGNTAEVLPGLVEDVRLKTAVEPHMVGHYSGK